MNGYNENIENLAISNKNFRKVVYTAKHMQLVLMSLLPNEDIGIEVHSETDQFLKIEEGEGKVILDGKEQLVKAGSSIVVPAKTQHNLINTSNTNHMKLYTLYSPPHHKDATVHVTKQDAEKGKE